MYQKIGLLRNMMDIYMTDKPIDEEGYIIYLVGHIITPSQEEQDSQYLLGEYTYVKWLSGETYPGGRIWYQQLFLVEHGAISRYSIVLGGANSTQRLWMIAWEGEVNERTIIKITKSFEY